MPQVDDKIVRKPAKNVVLKRWELMKTCKQIIDDQVEMLKEISLKEKLKEKVNWNVLEVKNYDEWKTKNMRFNLFERNYIESKWNRSI